MARKSTAAWVSEAWNPATLRRLGRAFQDLAVAEMTRDRGAARAPDFEARVRTLLSGGERGAGRTPAWLRALCEASLHQSHPRSMAQQICAPVPLAALVESLASALNQSIAVWEMSPAATIVDREILGRFKSLLGYPASAEGSLVPGGSFANLTALHAARAALTPEAWDEGQAAATGRIAILAGAHSHYSVSRAAGLMGLGARCVFPLPLDAAFRADTGAIPAVMRKARRAGYRHCILVATSGSTPTGSFDDLTAFTAAARRLRRQKIRTWLHVDAAHGGGMLFSSRLARLMRGIEQADSVAFDPHKMMFMPLAAGAVLVRSGQRIRGAFEQNAPYLFSPVRRAVADVGPMTLACSQRFDALKIWLVWQAYGPELFAALAEGVCAAARAGYDHCARSRRLEPAHEPEANILCFRLRHPPGDAAAADARHWNIKEAVNGSGYGYLSSTVLEGRRCFRIVVMNPRTTGADVVAVLRRIERLAGETGRA